MPSATAIYLRHGYRTECSRSMNIVLTHRIVNHRSSVDPANGDSNSSGDPVWLSRSSLPFWISFGEMTRSIYNSMRCYLEPPQAFHTTTGPLACFEVLTDWPC